MNEVTAPKSRGADTTKVSAPAAHTPSFATSQGSLDVIAPPGRPGASKSPEEALIDSFFARLSGIRKWQLISVIAAMAFALGVASVKYYSMMNTLSSSKAALTDHEVRLKSLEKELEKELERLEKIEEKYTQMKMLLRMYGITEENIGPVDHSLQPLPDDLRQQLQPGDP